ncbi:adenine deaminase [Candidatus Gottesmanbacteria bacterium RIFCSPLOWO2_02_FULL_40_10]|nr:MAG: adenine deaminase [Candidatus Gottesmanbacteria bacterium RIFCSPLOWO2_02_FULL_40_10]
MIRKKSANISFEIAGNLVDIHKEAVYPARLTIEDNKITDIKKQKRVSKKFIFPGFVDAHIHIESSMIPPCEFARLAVVHGTVAAVSDPHEIANVLGIKGVEYMISNGQKVPFKFYFGASPCVPATPFETAGGTLGVKEIKSLIERPEVKNLSEMMNYPGVLSGDSDVLEKIKLAKSNKKPIDGHAPGLAGKALKKYIKAGISTDHETVGIKEAVEKIRLGMKIIIREGSAAKNFNALIPLLNKYPEMCMFGSDDKHPGDLIKGHINELVKLAVSREYDLFKVLRCATLNPVNHYRLNVGLLRMGDWADFQIIDNLADFKIRAVFIDGQKVAASGRPLIKRIKPEIINNFSAQKVTDSDFSLPWAGNKRLKAIVAYDGQIVTGKFDATAKIKNGYLNSDTSRDILKIAVVNRYKKEKPAVSFIKNFGLKKGALASSVAHDSHNIISVGVTDKDLKDAVNGVIKSKGGLAVAVGGRVSVLPLPIAGLMSDKIGEHVALRLHKLDLLAKKLGSGLTSPFMTLSFMALLVIPALKLSDKGLFDSRKFQFVSQI